MKYCAVTLVSKVEVQLENSVCRRSFDIEHVIISQMDSHSMAADRRLLPT